MMCCIIFYEIYDSRHQLAATIIISHFLPGKLRGNNFLSIENMATNWSRINYYLFAIQYNNKKNC